MDWLPTAISIAGSGAAVWVAVARLEERIKVLERELDRVREWKHMKGEPYVNDMDNLNERVKKLESRRR